MYDYDRFINRCMSEVLTVLTAPLVGFRDTEMQQRDTAIVASMWGQMNDLSDKARRVGYFLGAVEVAYDKMANSLAERMAADRALLSGVFEVAIAAVSGGTASALGEAGLGLHEVLVESAKKLVELSLQRAADTANEEIDPFGVGPERQKQLIEGMLAEADSLTDAFYKMVDGDANARIVESVMTTYLSVCQRHQFRHAQGLSL